MDKLENAIVEESSDDSDNDENICKSPVKSPRKLSSVLKRKIDQPELINPSETDSSENDSIDEEIEAIEDHNKQSEFKFKEPTFRKKQFIFHPFQLKDGKFSPANDSSEQVTVTIPEQLAASYGLYIWPCAPVLAWYLWLHQLTFRNKRILELGAGTALPGILLAKIGCDVTLSDSISSPHCVNNCKEAVKLNNLENNVQVIPLSWGLMTSKLIGLKNKLDFIIGSDLFFDPDVFEKLVFTIKWLLNNNPGCQFICTVQERSADWSIELYLKKYKLSCSYEYPEQFLQGTGINPSDLTGNHTIFVLKIFLSEK